VNLYVIMKYNTIIRMEPNFLDYLQTYEVHGHSVTEEDMPH
jgi:hypothetical protein